MPDTHEPVLIVGAGPVGLTLALLLARDGVPVTVLDRDPGPTEQSRAVWVHARTLEVWDTIGLGGGEGAGTRPGAVEAPTVGDTVVAAGRTVAAIDLHVDGRRRATLPYDGGPGARRPHAVMLEQSGVQRILLDAARRAGVPVTWAAEVTDLREHDGACTVTATHGHTRSTYRASWVVGADGGSSTVRRLAGATLEGGTYDTAFFLADVDADTDLDPDRAHLHFHGRTTVAVLPLPAAGRYRVIGNLTGTTDRNAPGGYGRTPAPEEVRELLRRNALPMTIRSVGWTTTYRSHHRVADRFHHGRTVIVGDAAHLHSPAGALGMNAGIADAADLAWRLAAVTAGAPRSVIDGYETERRAVARNVIRTSDRLFVLQADTRPALAFIRRNVLPRVVGALTRTRAGQRLAYRALSGTAVHYPAGDGRGTGALRTGRLLPRTGVATLDHHEAARRGQHLVVVAGLDATALAAARAIADRRGWPLLDLSPEPLPPEHLSSERLRTVTGGTGPVVAWIRPDRYVGWSGTDPTAMDVVLHRTLGSPDARSGPDGRPRPDERPRAGGRSGPGGPSRPDDHDRPDRTADAP